MSDLDPKQHSKVLTEGPSRADTGSSLRNLRLLFTAAILLGFASLLSAQIYAQALYVPTAPKPPQLITARTVFLSNNTTAPLADSNKIFDEIYADVQRLNRFTIVSSPSDADVILEFSLQNLDTTQILTLRIIDCKTRVVLWSVGDAGQAKAIYGTNGKKNQHDIVDNIIDYLQIITSPKTN